MLNEQGMGANGNVILILYFKKFNFLLMSVVKLVSLK